MTDKPVKVTLESDDGQTNPIVHECDTIQQAEEWIAERGETDRQRVEDGKYGIDAPEEMMDAYATGANGATEVPPEAEKPMNHLFRIRNALSLLMTAVEDGVTGTDLQIVMTECNDALETIWGDDEVYAEMPELRAFDEIASQGREALIDWIEDGRPDPSLVDPVRLMDDGRDDILIPVPMSGHDTLTELRDRANEVIVGVGFGPASFAIPGLRGMLERLDFAAKVPTSEDHEEGTLPFRTLRFNSISLAEFKERPSTKRAIKRSSLQLVARG